jgi:hypothetical protein
MRDREAAGPQESEEEVELRVGLGLAEVRGSQTVGVETNSPTRPNGPAARTSPSRACACRPAGGAHLRPPAVDRTVA